ncbi:LLM class flavin-dependent oxidoreductase [Actinomadura rugatobispora]|uniref:LLM class flavin-dependent oxidoreductase n=1 Tax=Actinomadura rugatobispora TaxID=1994 RepID=A0ABW1A1A3_9ACTN|nr:hypothetical protein GCM10010200_083710 [Actinomadura rugatobispora]
MRIGVVLPTEADPDERTRAAAIADDVGLDMVVIESSEEADALLTVSSLADTVRWARLVAVVPVGMHPVHLAERIGVADQVLGGRLTVVLRSSGDRDELSETLEVLDKALAARPFRHRGARWRVPADLPENGDANWQQVRVTPAPVQPLVPIWLSGEGAGDVAAEFALSYLPPEDVDAGRLASWWAAVDQRWGPAAARLSRPLLAPPLEEGSPPDVGEQAEHVLQQQAAWGMDSALLRWNVGVPEAAARLRATVQIGALPPGLQSFWDETVSAAGRQDDW